MSDRPSALGAVAWQALAGLALCVGGMPAWADGMPAVTPYQPTVASPAELSQPGWLELELGGDRQRDGARRRQALPYAAKLAFNEDWGLILVGNLRVRESSAGRVAASGGDTTLMLKHRIATDEPSRNFGIELGFRAPTAGAGLGVDRRDWIANSIISQDFASGWRLDANLGVTRTGAAAPDQGRTQTQWAASLSRAMGNWNLAGELSGQRQGGVPAGSQWLAAASYVLSPRCVVDAGFSGGLQGWRGQHAVFVGGTWLVGRLL